MQTTLNKAGCISSTQGRAGALLYLQGCSHRLDKGREASPGSTGSPCGVHKAPSLKAACGNSPTLPIHPLHPRQRAMLLMQVEAGTEGYIHMPASDPPTNTISNNKHDADNSLPVSQRHFCPVCSIQAAATGLSSPV